MIAQQIDSGQSTVSFSLSNMGFRTVEGQFSGLDGDISFDPESLENSRFDVCIDASTVNTDNAKRDEHLRNEDFFEVTTYPTICYVSTSIKKTANGFISDGILSMHGQSKEASIPFTVENGVFAGTLSINRLDYNVGLDFKKFMVGYDVNVDIRCVTQ